MKTQKCKMKNTSSEKLFRTNPTTYIDTLYNTHSLSALHGFEIAASFCAPIIYRGCRCRYVGLVRKCFFRINEKKRRFSSTAEGKVNYCCFRSFGMA